MSNDEDELTPNQHAAIERILESNRELKEKPSKRRFRWRLFNRALHRDLGALAFGLTLLYAISGIALHHIDDIVVNPGTNTKTFNIEKPLPTTLQGFVDAVLEKSSIKTQPYEIYPASAEDRQRALAAADGEWQLKWADGHAIYINPRDGSATEVWQAKHTLLTLMNWLHASRGKPGWWRIGDTYGVILILLAISGLLMIQKKRLFGRAGLLILLGFVVPIAYAIRVLAEK